MQSELPALIAWTVPYDNLQTWPAISFADGGASANEYWDFIRLNRTLALPHRSLPLGYFDIVFGPVSSNYVNRKAIGDIDQVSFHTQTGLGYLAAARAVVFNVRTYTRPQTQRAMP